MCYHRPMFRMLVASIIAIVASGAAVADELRYKFERGQKLLFSMTQNMTMEFSGEGLPSQKSTTEQTTEMTWIVEEVEQDGTAKITQSIDRIKMDLNAPPRVTFQFDSAAEEEPTGTIAGMITPVLNAMVGASFDVSMNPRGEILQIQVPDAIVEAMQKVPNANQLGEMFTKQGLEKMVQQGALTFPEGELEAGREWESSFEMENPGLGGKQTITTKYRYVGQKEVDDASFDAFEVAIEMDFGEAVGPGGAKMSIKNQESQGHILFDREAGRMKSSSIDMKLDMEITAFGQTMNTQLTQNVKVDVRPAQN